ncbi:unnamed protein product [Phyllotreta striolata]|uniref:G-protein coupled receptor n=1 Tax=Phyllotreta striolata TaxID=444603 RepID=A0A9N9THW1_PHYSR|nr:unnamed protein product [Phyllotreta striolata]
MYRVAFFLTISALLRFSFGDYPCTNYVDITDGRRSGDDIIKDGVTYRKNDSFSVGASVKGCICNVLQCVRKCCDHGETMDLNLRKCVSSNKPLRNFSLFHIIVVPENEICDDVQTKVILDRDFTVIDGMLVWEDIAFALEDYCLTMEDDQYYAIACLEEDSGATRYFYSLAISNELPPTMILRILTLLSISVKVLSVELDLCNTEGTTPYANYTEEATQTCRCTEARRCIRKCCQLGYSLHHVEDAARGIYESTNLCYKRENFTHNFTVPVYSNYTKLREESTFLVGMLTCNRDEALRYFKLNDKDPNEKYYLQGNGSLFYPHSKRKFYLNDRYCVDEKDGLSVYLCFTQKDRRNTLRQFNSIGKLEQNMSIATNVLLLTLCLLEPVKYATPLDLCDLSGTAVYANYTSDVTSSCGCGDGTKCLRKCCQLGFYLHHDEYPIDNRIVEETVCVRNASAPLDFKVPVYRKRHFKRYQDDGFMVGLLPCNKGQRWKFFQINSSDPREEVFVQEDGVLYYPRSKRRFYANDRFCVDERDGFSVFLCYSSKHQEVVTVWKVSVAGINEGLFDDCDRRDACVRRCCEAGFVLKNKTCVGNGSNGTFVVRIYTNEKLLGLLDDRAVYKTGPLQCAAFRLNSKGSNYAYYLQANGDLWVPVYGIVYSNDRYCMDESGNLSVFLCNGATKVSRVVSVAGMIISTPFLLITFIVYFVLPERNIHRRALMSYVFTLLIAYITLVTIQLYTGQFPDVACHILGHLIIFFFLVSFFWMNVMCIDMWLAFSGMRTVLSKQTAERKRFIIYCVYAWGVPTIHTIIVFLINTYGDPDASYYPGIGKRRCFLGEELPTFYYFYLPMAILIGINIILFIATTVRIQRIKRETKMLKHSESKRHSYEDDKQKFNLYLKLMFAMGVNWTMELVSWAVDWKVKETPTFVWYLTDFTNAMYGLLIFMIFVFKKKIWKSLQKRYYVFVGKPHLAHTMTQSSGLGTRTSNYSTTETNLNSDYRLNEMRNSKPEESGLTAA